FQRVSQAQARLLETAQDASLRVLAEQAILPAKAAPEDAVLRRLPEVAASGPVVGAFSGGSPARPAVCYRQSGDANLLIEYGPAVLDLNLRFRAHALME